MFSSCFKFMVPCNNFLLLFRLGVITVSVPTVMKTEKLTIPKLSDIVDSVHEFSRNQKIHLEYVLIWALTKMMQPTHGFLGYKGNSQYLVSACLIGLVYYMSLTINLSLKHTFYHTVPLPYMYLVLFDVISVEGLI